MTHKQRLIIWITNSVMAAASVVLFQLSGHWVLAIMFAILFLIDVLIVFETLKEGSR
jgi:hypothetical protein